MVLKLGFEDIELPFDHLDKIRNRVKIQSVTIYRLKVHFFIDLRHQRSTLKSDGRKKKKEKRDNVKSTKLSSHIHTTLNMLCAAI
jgi:hypothetical protein